MAGRFTLHAPENTHVVTLRISQDLYDLLRHEVAVERSTIQGVATHILHTGIEARQEERLRKLRVEKARLAELREHELVGAAS
jgi:hypothetical protein